MERKEIIYLALLIFVTFIWGVTFPMIKDVFVYLSPVSFLAIRFVIASLIFLPFVYRKLKESNRDTIRYGVIAGIFLFIAYYLQTVGLMYTEPALSGTITGIYVVFVPLISYIYLRKRVMRIEIYSSVFAFIGLVLMSYSGLHNLAIEAGDILTFIAAIFYAMQLVYVSKYASDVDPLTFSFLQIVVVAVLSLAFMRTDMYPLVFSYYALFVVVFTAIFATFLATYIYVSALSRMNVTKVGVILIGEPIFADITSIFLFNEPVGPVEVLGICIMIASIGVISYFSD
ncbi:EamA/RhaT family transporter [Thermoplasma sp. Kam2015]|uniref:DMT family transporter n=1 Tax=Thermoplasma sp. Kam2015 TaxID=2094122 RepID=UPI000D82ECDD|nr:DMT family transporter [Thermoplasma sp. Kam2015]PYB67510.1 EamA/RhaT family transporter [Thermoplasma sp. Kam2015]